MAELIVDMSNPREKFLILSKFRELEGIQKITVCRYRKSRSDRQNRWYWSCFVQPLAEYMRAQGYGFSDEDAHEVLKFRFLRRSKEVAGIIVEYTQSTTELDTMEFNQYLDQCAAFLADYCGIHVPEPDVYREAANAA